MSPDLLFSLANGLAVPGWIALALAPLAPRAADRFAGVVLPGAFCALYTVLIAVHFAEAPGGFGTLREVQELFTDADVALAGWIHFLAFDLFVGAWIVRDARARGVAHWMVLPILPLAFLLGPAGLLCWLALRILLSNPTPQGDLP